jgi:chitin synthase
VQAAQLVLQALGNALGPRATDTSRFGYYTELQFDDRQKLVGTKILDFALDKSRVTQIPENERGFHVFYYFLAGAAPDQRAQWNLYDPSHFEYLKSGVRHIEKSDTEGFGQFLNALKVLGLSKKSQTQVFNVLAAILHLGQIQFVDDKNIETEEPETRIRNLDTVHWIAAWLGVDGDRLAESLLSNTTYIGKDKCTIVHAPEQAVLKASALAQSLYSLLFTWMIEFINSRLHSEATTCVIAIVDFPGELNEQSTPGSVSFQVDEPGQKSYWAELTRSFESRLDTFTSAYLVQLGEAYLKNGITTRLINDRELIHAPEVDAHVLRSKYTEENGEGLTLDVLSLFRNQCSSEFIAGLFSLRSITSAMERREQSHVPSKPLRKASIKRNPGTLDKPAKPLVSTEATNVLDDLNTAFSELLEDLKETNIFFIYLCMPNSPMEQKGQQLANVVARALPCQGDCVFQVSMSRLISRFSGLVALRGLDESSTPNERILGYLRSLLGSFADSHLVFSQEYVWFSWQALVIAEREVKRFKEYKKNAIREDGNKGNVRESIFDDVASYVSEDDTYMSDSMSVHDGFSVANGEYSDVPNGERPYSMGYAALPNSNSNNTLVSPEKNGKAAEGAANEPPEVSGQRKRWVFFCWLITFWIPSFLLRSLGRMKDEKVQQAWREKVTICFLIFLFSCLVIFMMFASFVICPNARKFNYADLLNASSDKPRKEKYFVGIRGSVYDIYQLSVTSNNPFHSKDMLSKTALLGETGVDLSMGFPVLPADACPDLVQDRTIEFSETNRNWTAANEIYSQHKGEIVRNPEFAARLENWLKTASRIKGNIVISEDEVKEAWNRVEKDDRLLRVIIGNNVYDLTNYYAKSVTDPRPEVKFLDLDKKTQSSSSNSVESIHSFILLQGANGDVNLNKNEKFMQLWNANPKLNSCFNLLFLRGKLDDRKSIKCLYTDYTLLAMSILLGALILVKFLAALQMRGGNETPEKMDKFVMIQIPCYTEDETSMANTINSLAAMKYDDKRKLMVIICDGMIVGRGNDRPTPRIVLDLLGVDPLLDPEPLSYQAIGEGSKQHNMAKVYSGLYEYEGHLVPYLVIVKVGRPSESSRPGNRGKRDSQIVLMRFLNHLHYEKPMSPLELEMRHHIQTVIGIDPKWYEYMLMVDADTMVDEDALTQLIAFNMTDTTIIGSCGETRLCNEKSSMITMIQVYEVRFNTIYQTFVWFDVIFINCPC